MDDSKKFHEVSLPEKDDIYSHLNIIDITDADYMHAKGVFKVFKIRHLGDYHDLYFQSIKLLSADVFENCQNMCLKIYELDPLLIFSLHQG